MMLHSARHRSKIQGKRLDEATFPQISLYNRFDKSSACGALNVEFDCEVSDTVIGWNKIWMLCKSIQEQENNVLLY